MDQSATTSIHVHHIFDGSGVDERPSKKSVVVNPLPEPGTSSQSYLVLGIPSMT